MDEEKAVSEEMKGYFDDIQKGVNECHEVASNARKMGFDPETFVDIKLAKNMAERVEGLMSTVCPQLVGSDIRDRP